MFVHYDDEYEQMTELRKKLTEDSGNALQKYFALREPIAIPAINDIPQTSYTHLYIRKPDPYRHHVGDMDFFLSQEKYNRLKAEMLAGKRVPGARIFDRPDLDMIELYSPDSDVLAYVSTKKMSGLVKAKRSEHTKL